MDYGIIDKTYAMHLATRPPEEDGPIWMVNYMRYKKHADYGEAGDKGISGQEADDRYAPTEVLARIGADVVFFGDVISSEDPAQAAWDRMAIVRYPTRKSFIDMQTRDDFQEKRVHKDAGMEFSIILCSLPRLRDGEDPASGDVVRFTAFPAGTSPSAKQRDGVHFDVEGTIIGDERRWDHLVISWSDASTEDLPEGAMVVTAKNTIDHIQEFVRTP